MLTPDKSAARPLGSEPSLVTGSEMQGLHHAISLPNVIDNVATVDPVLKPAQSEDLLKPMQTKVEHPPPTGSEAGIISANVPLPSTLQGHAISMPEVHLSVNSSGDHVPSNVPQAASLTAISPQAPAVEAPASKQSLNSPSAWDMDKPL